MKTIKTGSLVTRISSVLLSVLIVLPWSGATYAGMPSPEEIAIARRAAEKAAREAAKKASTPLNVIPPKKDVIPPEKDVIPPEKDVIPPKKDMIPPKKGEILPKKDELPDTVKKTDTTTNAETNLGNGDDEEFNRYADDKEKSPQLRDDTESEEKSYLERVKQFGGYVRSLLPGLSETGRTDDLSNNPPPPPTDTLTIIPTESDSVVPPSDSTSSSSNVVDITPSSDRVAGTTTASSSSSVIPSISTTTTAASSPTPEPSNEPAIEINPTVSANQTDSAQNGTANADAYVQVTQLDDVKTVFDADLINEMESNFIASDALFEQAGDDYISNVTNAFVDVFNTLPSIGLLAKDDSDVDGGRIHPGIDETVFKDYPVVTGQTEGLAFISMKVKVSLNDKECGSSFKGFKGFFAVSFVNSGSNSADWTVAVSGYDLPKPQIDVIKDCFGELSRGDSPFGTKGVKDGMFAGSHNLWKTEALLLLIGTGEAEWPDGLLELPEEGYKKLKKYLEARTPNSLPLDSTLFKLTK